jgi:hypothetical protein
VTEQNSSQPARGYLEVGTSGDGEVVVNHPDLEPDESGVGHIVFSVDEANNLAHLLQVKAVEARHEKEEKRREDAAAIPVDRSARELASGESVPTDQSHAELKENGQQKDYVVLSAAERAKGFVRPYRDAYRHLTCGKITTMGRAIAETYARDPTFYSGTFCTTCVGHFPVGENGEFVWYEMNGTTGAKVGT